MRRRDMISGISGFARNAHGGGRKHTASPELPDGTREIARLVDLPDKRPLLQLADRPPNYETPVDALLTR